jgi:hypothetical protein
MKFCHAAHSQCMPRYIVASLTVGDGGKGGYGKRWMMLKLRMLTLTSSLSELA